MLRLISSTTLSYFSFFFFPLYITHSFIFLSNLQREINELKKELGWATSGIQLAFSRTNRSDENGTEGTWRRNYQLEDKASLAR
jgi:hypothetical protein